MPRTMFNLSPSPAIATLDRRVDLIGRRIDDDRAAVRRVSDLRSLPYVVLLGEPGIGKSTVLQAEAEAEGAPMLKVRDIMTGAQSTPGTTIFLMHSMNTGPRA